MRSEGFVVRIRSQTLMVRPLNFGGIGSPWSAAGDDVIEEEKLSGAGDERVSHHEATR
jgi:hypothetical protein